MIRHAAAERVVVRALRGGGARALLGLVGALPLLGARLPGGRGRCA